MAAGRETLYCGGDEVDAVAWYDGDSGGKAHPVARKTANDFGLYDMSGNVWEWTCSVYTDRYDDGGSEKTCTDDAEAIRGVRGCGWDFHSARDVRSAIRGRGVPAYRYDFLGFRLVQD